MLSENSSEKSSSKKNILPSPPHYNSDHKRKSIVENHTSPKAIKLSIQKKEYEQNETNLKQKIIQDTYRFKSKEVDSEIEVLKAVNEELKVQVNELLDVLQQTEKEMNKLLFEKEIYFKKEEELKHIIEDIKRKEENFKKEIKDLKAVNDIIESDKTQLGKALADAKHYIEKLQQILKIKEDAIMNLHKSYNTLEKELDTVSSPKFKIETKKIDFNRLKIPERIGISSSPDPFEYNFTERDEDYSYKAMYQEAMKIIGVTGNKDFHSKLLHLRQYHSKYKRSKKIIDRISNMIVQCSPEGLFKNEPTIRQIWKWITRLLEEYMKIKQSVTGECYSKLCELLETDSPEDMLKKVEELQKFKQLR